MYKLLTRFCTLVVSLILFTNCASSLYEHGKSFLRSEQYDEAIRIFRTELKAKPENNKLWRDLGIAYLKKGKQDSALSVLEKAHQLNDKDGSTIFYLGAIYEERGNYSQAIQYYRQYGNVGRFKKIRRKIETRLESLARKELKAEIDSLLAHEAEIDPASISDSTIAVLYFENLGQNRQLDPLQKGLAEVLSYDLSKVKALRVLERIRLEELLRELQTAGVDTPTAPRLGKLLGAKTLVKGSFIDLDNRGQIRIDASLIRINAQTQAFQILKEVTGKLDHFFRLEKNIVFNVLDQMHITLTDKERTSIQEVPTEDMFAFMAFSRGLHLEDQGRFEEARVLYRQALARDPKFEIARDKIDVVTRLQSVEAIGTIEVDVLEGILNVEQTTRDRLGSSGALVNAGVLPGQDERDTIQEATGTERFVGIPVNVQIVVPPNLNKK